MLLISIKTLQDDRFTSATKYWRLIFEESTIGFEQEEANLIVDIHIGECQSICSFNRCCDWNV